MKKYTFIGLYKSGRCCLLESLLDWDNLDFDNLESSDFRHSSTNWCGSDELARTLELEELGLTGRSKTLNKPLLFSGTDWDCGHSQNWSGEVVNILETNK